MDRHEILKLNPETFNYKKGLIDTFRGCEDPLSNELEHVDYEMNPSDVIPTREVKFFDSQADVDAGG